MFTQPFIQTQIKENIKAPRHWSSWTSEFPAQMASEAENVSIWWRHHDDTEWICILTGFLNSNEFNVEIFSHNNEPMEKHRLPQHNLHEIYAQKLHVLVNDVL